MDVMCHFWGAYLRDSPYCTVSLFPPKYAVKVEACFDAPWYHLVMCLPADQLPQLTHGA